MSADLLRRAARAMREKAEAATPGPWESCEVIGLFGVQQPESHGGHLICETQRCAEDGHADRTAEDADHIAAWHPGVALAVADLLDAYADGFYPGSRTEPAGRVGPRIVAVARAFPGEEAS